VIHFGIVGIGGFATTWIECLQALEEKGLGRLAAAVVRNPAKYSEKIAFLKQKRCRIYSSLTEMLVQREQPLDIIGIPTGIPSHAPLGVQALSAGYNTLIEKPVAATIQEVRHLQEAEQKAGRWCAIGYQMIYSPTIQWLRQKITSGALGQIKEMRSLIGWPRTASYYTRNSWAGQLRLGESWVLDGPATNATAHYLTNMLYLAGAQKGGKIEIAKVRAELYRAKSIPSYDTSCIEIQMTSGTRILHYASHSLSRNLHPIMQIIGEKGYVEWQAPGNVATIYYTDGKKEEFADPSPETIHQRPFEQVARVAMGKDSAPLCGLNEGGPHVLAIDLAFESSQGCFSIPSRFLYTCRGDDGTELICIQNMEEILQEAYSKGTLFAEMEVPWAKETQPVSAAGYTYFPSKTLEGKLKEAIQG